MTTIVQKYGGTSVAGREKILAIAERLAALRRSGHDVVVVVSAPGGTTDSPTLRQWRPSRTSASWTC